MQIKKINWIILFLMIDIMLGLLIYQLYVQTTVQVATVSQTSKGETVERQTQVLKTPVKDEPEKPIDAPHIHQLPELQRGCEVTTLAMLLQDAGVNVTKMELAKEIDKVPFKQNGLMGNPHEGFVGNIYTYSKPGYAVYHEPLTQLAAQYLPNKIIDITGQSFKAIEKQIDRGIPVLVITNYLFEPLPDAKFKTWKTSSGPVKITYSEHSVLVTGYDDEYIYFNNPKGKKNEKAERDAFISAWKQLGNQAISYRR